MTTKEKLTSWPFTGLTRPQALERRNVFLTWLLLIIAGLTFAYLAGFGWLWWQSDQAVTIEQVLGAGRRQVEYTLMGGPLLLAWLLPLIAGRLTRGAMPTA